MLDFNNVCIHGTVVWNNTKNNKISSEYFEGSYPLVLCEIKGTNCDFKNNYQNCALWAKKDKE